MQSSVFQNNYPEQFNTGEKNPVETQPPVPAVSTNSISRNSLELLKSWLYHNQQTITESVAATSIVPRIYLSVDISNILIKIDQWLYFKIGDWRVYFRSKDELEHNLNLVNNIITSISLTWIDFALTWHNPLSKVFSKISTSSFIDTVKIKCSTQQLDYIKQYTKLEDIFNELKTVKIGSCMDIYTILPDFIKRRINFLLNIHPSNFQPISRGETMSNDRSAIFGYLNNDIDFKPVNSKPQFLGQETLHPYAR